MKYEVGKAFRPVGAKGGLTIDTDEMEEEVAEASSEACAEVIVERLRSGLLPDGSPTPQPSVRSKALGTRSWGIRTGQLIASIRAEDGAVAADAEPGQLERVFGEFDGESLMQSPDVAAANDVALKGLLKGR